jgi:hypothetical protein
MKEERTNERKLKKTTERGEIKRAERKVRHGHIEVRKE